MRLRIQINYSLRSIDWWHGVTTYLNSRVMLRSRSSWKHLFNLFLNSRLYKGVETIRGRIYWCIRVRNDSCLLDRARFRMGTLRLGLAKNIMDKPSTSIKYARRCLFLFVVMMIQILNV